MKLPHQHGFTLIELVIIIVVLGIIAAVAIPKFGSMTQNSKISATKDEMLRIKTAIIGDARVISGGQYIDRGFEGDVGFPPSRLVDLVIRPDSIPVYDRITRLGWNGPYLDSSLQNYATDSWGSAYVYDPNNRTVTSTGVTPNIVTTF
nr:prepilin-type N-terminal cleavage/methylation domain-containing protein [candidate division Zixibacteria bacterium]